jgi:hypothetical protein
MSAGLEEPAEQTQTGRHLHETINKGLDSTPYVEPTGVVEDGTLNALDSTSSEDDSGKLPEEFDG